MKKTILAGALFALAACSSSPFFSFSDKKAPIASYKTYQWISQSEADQLRLMKPPIDYMSGNVKVVRRPDLEQKLRSDIEADLNKEGYKANTDGNPDFYVTFYGKAKDENWVSSWEGNTAGVRNVPVVIFPEFDRDKARNYTEGTVYVTVYDARSKAPAWTGVMTKPNIGPTLTESEASSAVSQIVTEFGKEARPG